MQIAVFGWLCQGSGQVGNTRFTSFSRKLSFAGTARVFVIAGDGKVVTAVVRKLISKFVY